MTKAPSTLSLSLSTLPLSLLSLSPSTPLLSGPVPQHHMYYDDRVIDVNDDLPKFKGSTRHELWTPP